MPWHNVEQLSFLVMKLWNFTCNLGPQERRNDFRLSNLVSVQPHSNSFSRCDKIFLFSANFLLFPINIVPKCYKSEGMRDVVI